MSDLVNSNPPLKVFAQPTAANDGFVLLNWNKEALTEAINEIGGINNLAKSLAMDLQYSIPSKTLSIKDQTFS